MTFAKSILFVLTGIGGSLLAADIGTQDPAAQNRLRFEVASVKLAGDDAGRGGLEILPGGGLKMAGVTLKSLVAFAYGVMEDRISGGPNWIGSITYSVLAKPENPHPADVGQVTFAPGSAGWIRVQQRTQSLLEERFQLMIHRDARESVGYVLVPAKGGVKLKQTTDQGNPRTMRSRGRIDAQRGTMEMLATVLSQMLGRKVEDRTGLTGTYDYKLEYAQDSSPDHPQPEFGGPSVFTAIQEQLGLKLEQSKVTTATIIIDRAEKLSAN